MTDFYPLGAIFILTLGGCALLVAGRLLEQLGLAMVFTASMMGIALACLAFSSGGDTGIVRGIVVDDFSRFLSIFACAGALTSVLATSSGLRQEGIEMVSEYYFLILMSLSGALVMICASDLLTLFIGLEVASLALYCLCGARIKERASSESALKYFLLGCFSSAFFLYGIALWYGATGSLSLHSSRAISLDGSALLMISFVLLLIGLGFKIGLAPFHFWVPDVYQGAPVSVTTFMSCVVKIAAFAALIKICVVSFALPSEWAAKILWVLAALAMTVGNLAALQQRSAKRMLAYSSVAHAGYMLMGITAVAAGSAAISASLFYLVAYSAMTIGAFGVLSAIGPDADNIDDLRGMVRRSPFLAVCMTLFCLALAGLPPGMAGLLGKVYLFSVSVEANFTGLAIIAALNSAVACVYYFRIPMAMLFQSGDDREPISVSMLSRVSLAVCATAVVVLGCLPEGIFSSTASGASLLFNRTPEARAHYLEGVVPPY